MVRIPSVATQKVYKVHTKIRAPHSKMWVIERFEVTITPYGEEMCWDMDAPEECPCCGVWQGEDHEEGCEIAECAECNATVDECRCHWES